MSAISSITSGVPATDYTSEPYEIAHGNKAAKSAYTEGLGLEQMFVDQLTQQLSATLSSDPTDSTDSSGDSSDDSSDSSSDGVAGPYSSLLSTALTQGVMSSGGAGGLAMQLAESIDPSLALPSK